MKFGPTVSFLLPYPKRRKKNKHFTENGMKNNKVMTVLLPQNVIFGLLSNSSHVASIFHCTSSKNYAVTLKKKKNFSELPTLYQNEAEIRNKTFCLKPYTCLTVE